MTQMPSVMWFEDLGRGDVALVGGKNASLGKSYVFDVARARASTTCTI